jgi:predicted GNAT family N-acyltransferase
MTLHCRIADWQADKSRLQSIRQQVFVVEQQVPQQLEWDAFDASAVHFIAELDAKAVATARLKIDNASTAQIGRMAVLEPYRKQGVAQQLLQTILEYCDHNGITQLYLHAQIQVVGFYEQFGFAAQGEIFQDAGIAHRAMSRNCAKKRS